MIRFLSTLFLIVLFSYPDTGWASKQLVVGDFSGKPQNGALPNHWKPLGFDAIDKHTVYTRVADEGTWVIQAESRAGSSGLIRKITIDPSLYPVISFRWKIQDILDSADLTNKSGNDAPARVFITFAYDSDKISWFKKMELGAVKLSYGEYPPVATLIYVWASHLEKGTVIESPHSSSVKVIVLESGADKKGQWLSEERNVYDDYCTAFGFENVPMVSGVAIMTDTDNTGEQAVAWYGDIIFSSSLSR